MFLLLTSLSLTAQLSMPCFSLYTTEVQLSSKIFLIKLFVCLFYAPSCSRGETIKQVKARMLGVTAEDTAHWSGGGGWGGAGEDSPLEMNDLSRLSPGESGEAQNRSFHTSMEAHIFV